MPGLSVSGWGQAAGALAGVAPEAEALDIAAFAPLEPALAALAQQAETAEYIIGWSMGGQLAARAIARGLVSPKRLVLIAAPFQFVRSDSLTLGMGRDTFAQFRANYARAPERTLAKAHALVWHGDSRAEIVRAKASAAPLPAHDWVGWLEWLGSASCEGLDVARFPPTLLIHGEGDAVVEAAQSAHWASLLPHVEFKLIPACGHAPHWHDERGMRAMIGEFLHV